MSEVRQEVNHRAGGFLLHISVRPDLIRRDALAVEEVERHAEITTIWLHVTDPTCLENWPLLCNHLESRENLHTLYLVNHVEPTIDLARLFQKLQRNPNIQEFLFLCTESMPVRPLVDFLDAGATRLTLVCLDCKLDLEGDGNNLDRPALLAASMERLTNLEKLELGFNLQVPYASAILETLERPSSVQSLTVRMFVYNETLWDPLVRLFRKTSKIRHLAINSYLQETLPGDHLLQIARCNTSLRSMRFRHDRPTLEVQRKLDFYMNRNKRLDEWIARPAGLPSHLWSDALHVASRASDPSVLYRSVLAIKDKLDLTRRKRKRRKPDLFKPS